jgi:hypothetical protein
MNKSGLNIFYLGKNCGKLSSLCLFNLGFLSKTNIGFEGYKKYCLSFFILIGVLLYQKILTEILLMIVACSL